MRRLHSPAPALVGVVSVQELEQRQKEKQKEKEKEKKRRAKLRKKAEKERVEEESRQRKVIFVFCRPRVFSCGAESDPTLLLFFVPSIPLADDLVLASRVRSARRSKSGVFLLGAGAAYVYSQADRPRPSPNVPCPEDQGKDFFLTLCIVCHLSHTKL